MNKKFTQNDFIKLIYNEVSPEKHAQMMEAIASDIELNRTYLTLKEVHTALRTVKAPAIDARVTETILNYAAEAQSEMADHV